MNCLGLMAWRRRFGPLGLDHGYMVSLALDFVVRSG